MKKLAALLVSLIASVSIAAETAPQKLTVVLDWFPNPDHAPLIIAKQQGYFKEEGLEVDLIGPADPADPPKLAAAGKADIAITYEPEFMQQVDRGLPLIRIGTLIDKPLDCVVTLKSSGIQSLADLKGKRIGTGSNGLSSVTIKAMLSQAGLTEKDVTIVNVKYNLTQALLTHQIDAVTGMMRNFEVPQLELAGQKVNAFFPEEHGIPNYSVLIYVTNLANIHDPRLPRFLSALKKAVRYIDENPQTAWQQFAALHPESNNPVNHQAWFATLPYFSEDPANFHAKDWQHFAEFMHEQGIIKKVQPISRYAVIVR